MTQESTANLLNRAGSDPIRGCQLLVELKKVISATQHL